MGWIESEPFRVTGPYAADVLGAAQAAQSEPRKCQIALRITPGSPTVIPVFPGFRGGAELGGEEADAKLAPPFYEHMP